jgi:hypothetical protein
MRRERRAAGTPPAGPHPRDRAPTGFTGAGDEGKGGMRNIGTKSHASDRLGFVLRWIATDAHDGNDPDSVQVTTVR